MNFSNPKHVKYLKERIKADTLNEIADNKEKLNETQRKIGGIGFDTDNDGEDGIGVVFTFADKKSSFSIGYPDSFRDESTKIIRETLESQGYKILEPKQWYEKVEINVSK